MSSPAPTRDPANDRFPPQIKYIVGNEACERFSFYGMIGILQIYVANRLGAGQDSATEISHLFKSANYFMPLLGAWIADRFLGRYRSILYLSLFYCAGHAMLAVGEGTYWGLYWGLGLIALGSGGIKPSVSAFVGDQFGPGQSHLLRKVYGWFYWSINFGSFFSFLLIPWIRDRDPATTIIHGYPWAFGIPGIFMGLATLIFWLGTPNYDRVPPAGDPPAAFFRALGLAAITGGLVAAVYWICGLLHLGGAATVGIYAVAALAAVMFATRSLHRRVEAATAPRVDGPFTVSWYLVTKRLAGSGGCGFYEAGKPFFTSPSLDDAGALLRVLKVLALIPFFWALYDQTNSTWVTQGTLMQPWVVPFTSGFAIGGEQMQSMNALLVMILVPVFTLGAYPWLDRLGWKATPLRRMMVGLVLTSISFVMVGLMQQRMDALALQGQKLSVLWQTIPYIVLTAGEVLVSATGNEFAYTHSPKTMKSTMTSIWLLTISVGNLLVAFFTWATRQLGSASGAAGESHAASAGQFFRYAAMTSVVSVVFFFVASRFKGKDYANTSDEPQTT